MSRIEQPPTNRLLPSYGPPTAGSGLEPAVAPNSPWRWNGEGWTSDPVTVSWSAGAVIPTFAAPAAGQLGVIIGTTGTNPSDVLGSAGSAGFGNPTTFASWDGTDFIYDPSNASLAAPNDGAGTAYLTWSLAPESNNPASTFAYDNSDTLPTETRTVADILGADFTVDAPGTWSEEAIGNPGDFAIDLSSDGLDLWGPRGVNGWGNPAARLAPVLQAPDGTQHRIVVANDGTLSTELA